MLFQHIIEINKSDNSMRVLDGVNDSSSTFDCGVLDDCDFNFTEPDTLATKLNLTVSTSTVFDVTIRTVEHNITRHVDTLTRNEGAWEGRSLCEFWLVQVAMCKLNASDVQFALDTNGCWFQLFAKNVDVHHRACVNQARLLPPPGSASRVSAKPRNSAFPSFT